MVSRKVQILVYVALLAKCVLHTFAFSVFPAEKSVYRIPTRQDENVQIEMPDFEVLINEIKEISPLACMAIDGQVGGFDVADEKYKSPLKWKTVEARKGSAVHHIDKCEHYNGSKFPVVRFRSSMKGPCIGKKMTEYIMKVEERSKWDPQIQDVIEMYSAKDLENAQEIMGDQFGDCTMLGLGYTKTKRYLVVDGREQLTLCGLQEFSTGASLIWGVEMEDRNDYLFPGGKVGSTRAKTQIFTTALVPTGDDTFDVEYCLQLDPGGNLPGFLTIPILIDSVKTFFTNAKRDFGDEKLMNEWIEEHLTASNGNTSGDDDEEEMRRDRLGLLLTP